MLQVPLTFVARFTLTVKAERNAGEASAYDPRCFLFFVFFLEELSFITRATPAYYVARLGKMLKNIISLEEQHLAKVSFILDPASKFKDPGQMIEAFTHWRGVCTSAEESDRLLGVFSIY